MVAIQNRKANSIIFIELPFLPFDMSDYILFIIYLLSITYSVSISIKKFGLNSIMEIDCQEISLYIAYLTEKY